MKTILRNSIRLSWLPQKAIRQGGSYFKLNYSPPRRTSPKSLVSKPCVRRITGLIFTTFRCNPGTSRSQASRSQIIQSPPVSGGIYSAIVGLGSICGKIAAAHLVDFFRFSRRMRRNCRAARTPAFGKHHNKADVCAVRLNGTFIPCTERQLAANFGRTIRDKK